jgi:hypothetical protein
MGCRLLAARFRDSGQCKELRHSVKLYVTLDGVLLPAEHGGLLLLCVPAARRSDHEMQEGSSESNRIDPFTDFRLRQSRISY